MVEWFAWIRGHMNVVLFFTLPAMALGSWIMLRKRGYNFGEHLIMHCYAYGFTSILMTPFYAFGNPMDLGNTFQLIVSTIFLGYYSWVYKDVFKMAWWKAILTTLVWYLFYFLIIIVSSLLLGIIGGIIGVFIYMGLQKIGLIG